MEVSDKKILIIGAARSGIASAAFLQSHGAVVALNDRKPLDQWSTEALRLKEIGVGLIAGDPPSWLLDQIDLLVLSPGVPAKSIPARYVDRAGAEVIGEVELAARFLRGRVVAITGTNGKTTTTTLIGELLQDAGLRVQVAGNIGKPLISIVETSTDDGWSVAELSSFQLETIVNFHPSIAVVLNVTPNHMDRYQTITDYAAAKHRIFMNQTEDDIAILNAGDQIVSSWKSGLRARVVLFSSRRELEEGLFLRSDGELVARTRDGERVLANRKDVQLRGLHNIENVLASLAVGLACGASPDSMRETLLRFKAVEHRLEPVAEIAGVTFYNDSKATSVDATRNAIEALAEGSGKLVLILGGRGKNAPYLPLEPHIRKSARALILIGEDAPAIERELSGAAPIERASDMHDAVRKAFNAAQKGDVVVLAPACSSFDMFVSFEHRGKAFKEAVAELQIHTVCSKSQRTRDEQRSSTSRGSS